MIADHCTDEFELLEGKHSVEFEGRIPLDVLSSMERENHGNVRYTCTALMAIPEDGDTEMVSGIHNVKLSRLPYRYKTL